jgi:type II secretory ATPase GspE/PulE/Tfp pilus assembly ATPase PilB-like protein
LLVLCKDHSAVAASTELVLNQRLVRRLCEKCSGKGCAECLQTGYRGRLPLLEWLRVSDTMRRSIVARELDALTVQPSLAENARALAETGLTNTLEVQRVLG